MEKKKKTTLSVKVNEEDKQWLKEHCEDTGNKLSDIIALLIAFYKELK